MKKFIIILGIICIPTLPVLSACPIDTGVCKAQINSNWETGSLNNKLIPNNLGNMQKTNAFNSTYKKKYYDELVNTQSNSTNQEKLNYNANCQFGVCLPGMFEDLDELE
ncbi:MAG: hypothetical protein R3Y28_05210 [Candidatus Gastranaerophilales bacterium]